VTDARRPSASLTIYDVARRAGVSIASVSRVLNQQGSPRPETRARVMRAVRELGFVPDGAARALSNRLKEVVSVVFRRGGEAVFEGEGQSLLFTDVINRGIEPAAQHRGYDVLMSSVELHDQNAAARLSALAAKSDGLILHDRILSAAGVARLAKRIPIVTLAGTPAPPAVNVRSDNEAGMRAIVRHLLVDHGYRSIAYLSGHADSPDNLARAQGFEIEADIAGAEIFAGPAWAGNYSAAGGAKVVTSLLAAGGKLPRAIACANDQAALGVIYALGERGLEVPRDVAVTGFDDIPVARHMHPPLTTSRQPIWELGTTAFDVLYCMISGEPQTEPEVVLPVELIIRGSCGCVPAPVPPPTLARADGEAR
jgi:LacI family transcriptional regulator, galactose operon repressor